MPTGSTDQEDLESNTPVDVDWRIDPYPQGITSLVYQVREETGQVQRQGIFAMNTAIIYSQTDKCPGRGIKQVNYNEYMHMYK